MYCITICQVPLGVQCQDCLLDAISNIQLVLRRWGGGTWVKKCLWYSSVSVFNLSGWFPVKTNEKCEDRLLLPYPRQCPRAPPLSNLTPGAWRFPCHLLGQLHSLWREAGLGCVPSRMLLGPPPAASVLQPVGSHGTLHWGHWETGAQSEARNQNRKGHHNRGGPG